MHKQQPSVAILVSTYNWPEALALVLKSIAVQSRRPDEIIIADDGSSASTKETIEAYAESFKLPIKHIWHEDEGFRKSLILNKAVKAAQSDYIIEIDGDIIIHSKFVEDHMDAAEKGFFVQGSRAMLKEEKSREILKSKDCILSYWSPGLVNRFNALRIPALSRFFQLLKTNPYHIKGCNLAFWRTDYIAINGYCNNFSGWGGEDYEFGARLLHHGIKRKLLKFAAISFHIHHEISSKRNAKNNDVIYRETLKNKSSWCSDGYSQVY